MNVSIGEYHVSISINPAVIAKVVVLLALAYLLLKGCNSLVNNFEPKVGNLIVCMKLHDFEKQKNTDINHN